MGVADIGVNIVTGAVLQFAAGRSGQSLGGRWRSGEGRQLLIEGPFEGDSKQDAETAAAAALLEKIS